MSSLHRRKGHKESENLVTPDSDTSEPVSTKSHLRRERDTLKHEVNTLRKNKEKKSLVGSRKFLIPLAVLAGVVSSYVLTQTTDGLQMQAQMQAQVALLMDQYDLQLPQLPDFDFSRVAVEWNRIRSSLNIPELWKFNRDGREFQVGDRLKERGLSAEYPVVLIPGVISTGLESWSTSPEYRNFFREKLWGGISMVTQVTFNQDQWIAAMMLDPVTGLDPPDVKVRAAEGIDAASTFIQGFWIWSKIVENLAVLNYDTNNLHLAPYDWRLSYWNLEERDGYFSRLKTTIEGHKKRQGKKTVIVAHSMGATIILYFFKWVEAPGFGDGGPTWVEDNIESYVSIAGTHLGVPKSISAFLSGEMRDTVQLNPAGSYVLEKFFSRSERRKLFLSWAGSASMWIKGGNVIWGNLTHAPDDDASTTHSHGELIAFRSQNISTAREGDPTSNLSATDATTWILQHTPSAFQKMMATNYSLGFERDEQQLKANNLDHTKWTNPLEVQLPYAPSMKIYCVYGHGKETERSYWYARGEYEHDDDSADSQNPVCTDPTDESCITQRTPLDLPLTRKNWIDAEYTDLTSWPKVLNGVKMGEGDGTVGLLSLGAMCVDGWKRPRWNPAGINITTVELPHDPVSTLPRGGANTSDHVDILGSTGLNEIILKVASGAGSEIEERFVSNIREYSRRIAWD